MKDNIEENQGGMLIEELMRVMLEDIRKNTGSTREIGVQVAQLAVAIGELAGIKDRVASLEEKVVAVSGDVAMVKAAVEKPAVTSEDTERLRLDIRAVTEFFGRPLKKEIHHRHFFGWPFVVVTIMLVVALGCVTATVYTYKRLDQYSASDIEFRSLKLINDSLLLRKVLGAERRYGDNPDRFRNDVNAEENRRAKLLERLLELNEKKGEVQKLEEEDPNKKN